MLIRLLSALPWFRQQAIIIVSETEIRAENVQSRVKAVAPRKASHPRTLIGDFLIVEQELIDILGKVFPRKWIKSDLLICMQGLSDGGYTNLEKRGFRELGYGVGAKNVFLAERQISSHMAIELFDGKLQMEIVEA